MTPREQVFRLVRRARVRLEAVRLLGAAARGALAGGVLGLLVLLAMKVLPGLPVRAALPWALPAFGAALALLHAVAAGPRIGLAAAALFLDRRLAARERFVTVVTCPPGPFTDRAAGEIGTRVALPRLPFPREAALVPAALFLLFAAGLLPAAGAAAPARRVTVVEGAGTPAAADAPPAELSPEDLEGLRRGEPPAPAEAEALAEAIERLHRPEDRSSAREALARARAGDGEGAREVARALAPPGGGGGAIRPAAYPDEAQFVVEYRRALSEEKTE